VLQVKFIPFSIPDNSQKQVMSTFWHIVQKAGREVNRDASETSIQAFWKNGEKTHCKIQGRMAGGYCILKLIIWRF